jgi:hypothetical protein
MRRFCFITLLLLAVVPSFNAAIGADSSAIASATAEALPKAAGAQPPPQPALSQAQQPDAIMCAAPGAPHGWISVPAGKKPTDFCPQNFIRDRLLHLPVVNDAAPPAKWPQDNYLNTPGHPP